MTDLYDRYECAECGESIDPGVWCDNPDCMLGPDPDESQETDKQVSGEAVEVEPNDAPGNMESHEEILEDMETEVDDRQTQLESLDPEVEPDVETDPDSELKTDSDD